MFEIDLFDATLALSACLALLAGFVSFLSPCVLPIVPPYLAYMAGTSPAAMGGGDDADADADRRVIRAALFFVLGLSTVFLLMGFAASAIGRVFLSYQRELGIASGVVIFVFGLHFLKVIQIPFLFREARIDTKAVGGTMLGAYVLGLAFAFGWTPCIGPVLGAILSMAAQEQSLVRALVLMGAYAAGLGIPFLIAAIFLRRFMGIMGGLRRHMGLVEKVMGVMLILVGILLMSNRFADISFWLLETFPILGTIG